MSPNSKKTFILFLTVAVLLVAVLLIGVAVPVMADSNNSNSDYGLTTTAKKAGLEKTEPAAFIGDAIGFVLSFVGVVFFGLMVYGGMIWLTARGNEQRVEKAKDIIVNAAIGIVIVFIAYGVTNLIIQRFAGGGEQAAQQSTGGGN